MLRLTLASVLILITASVQAGTADWRRTRAHDVMAALKARTQPPSVFAPQFIAAVPRAQLAALIARLQQDHGRLTGIETITPQTPTTARFTLRFARALADASLSIERDAPHRVTGFRIGAVRPIGDSPVRIAADFAAFPARSGFAVVRLSDREQPETILAAHADTQFAIGSAFKLWVLDALAEDIAAGRHRWDEVVSLGPRSLPSGVLQDWPPAAPLTVETLATLMIGMSDNTATDTLIARIGRERVADRLRATGHSDPARMLPLLTTAESFALKLSPPAIRNTYAEANDADQARQLAALDTSAVLRAADVTALDAAPAAIDTIEWFASPMDIARVLDSLRKRADPRVLQILSVVPNLPDTLRGRFAYAGYKGGSELGVLNLTWLLRTRAGEWIVVTASANDSKRAIDSPRFAEMAERLVRLTAP